MFKHCIIYILLLMSPLCRADVELPLLFSDHMVLQRHEPIKIYGTADANETVEVHFKDEVLSTTADNAGNWSVLLKSHDAGGPYEMSIKGNNTITLADLYIGEVWFCSGQSNMGWKLENTLNGEEELANADYPEIKLFTPKRFMSDAPTKELIAGTWETCTPKNAKGFSAVAYFFGRHLYEKYKVPIGLINSSWGGTNIEAWMREGLFDKGSEQYEIIAKMKGTDMVQAEKQFGVDDIAYRELIEDIDLGGKEGWEKLSTDYSDWRILNLPNRWAFTEIEKAYGVVWVTKEIELTDTMVQDDLSLSIGRVDDKDVTYFNGVKLGESAQKDLERVYAIPKDLLKVGKNRITIKVVNFRDYGGFRSSDSELFIATPSNSETLSLVGEWQYKVGTPDVQAPPARVHPRYYPTSLYNSMVYPFLDYNIKGVIWYQGESNVGNPDEYAQFFPSMVNDWRALWGKDFPFLFVQVANYAQQQDREAALRYAQESALSLDKTAMVVTLDIGEDFNVHPRNKQEVGKRLGMAAQNIAYGEKEISTGGPRVKKSKFCEEAVTLTFDQKLEFKGDRNALNGFAIAGKDKKFLKAATEVLSDKKVKVFNNNVKEPMYVRYLWEDAPGELMIYNDQGLPAPAFSITEK